MSRCLSILCVLAWRSITSYTDIKMFVSTLCISLAEHYFLHWCQDVCQYFVYWLGGALLLTLMSRCLSVLCVLAWRSITSYTDVKMFVNTLCIGLAEHYFLHWCQDVCQYFVYWLGGALLLTLMSRCLSILCVLAWRSITSYTDVNMFVNTLCSSLAEHYFLHWCQDVCQYFV